MGGGPFPTERNTYSIWERSTGRFIVFFSTRRNTHTYTYIYICIYILYIYFYIHINDSASQVSKTVEACTMFPLDFGLVEREYLPQSSEKSKGKELGHMEKPK